MREKAKVVIKFFINNALIRTETEVRSVYIIDGKRCINYGGKKFPIDSNNYVYAKYKTIKGKLKMEE